MWNSLPVTFAIDFAERDSCSDRHDSDWTVSHSEDSTLNNINSLVVLYLLIIALFSNMGESKKQTRKQMAQATAARKRRLQNKLSDVIVTNDMAKASM